MGQDDDTVEIPFRLLGCVARLALALVLLATVGALALGEPRPWWFIAPAGLLGIVWAASSVRLIVLRPPALRATAAGICLGGAAIIPWQDIQAISQTCDYQHAEKRLLRAIELAFYRRNTLLRVPASLWLTAIIGGDIRIGVPAGCPLPSVLVSRLEAMRVQACGTEDGVVSGTSQLPPARIAGPR